MIDYTVIHGVDPKTTNLYILQPKTTYFAEITRARKREILESSHLSRHM